MSKDIQLVSFVDGLAVSRVTEVAGATPRTVRVTGGGNFSFTQQVRVNDRQVDSFTVVSSGVLLVRPGAALDGTPVDDMEVVVLSSRLTSLRNAQVVFGLTSEPTSVSGILQLAQKVLRVLLSRPGSHKFLRWEGGGLVESLGVTLSENNKSAIAASVAQAVASVADQIRSEQERTRTAAAEKLLSLTLVGVSFDPARQRATATIRLTNQLGQSGEVPLTL